MSFKESVTNVAVEWAIKYARKDFDRNAPRILKLVEKADVKKSKPFYLRRTAQGYGRSQ